MALVAVCRRMNADCVPHGFRSTFRDWCAERTNVAREVAEMALAHESATKSRRLSAVAIFSTSDVI